MRCDRLEFIVNGTTYNFSGNNIPRNRSKYVWLSETGFGSPSTNRILEQGPFQHGVSNIDFRLGARTIQLAFLSIAQTVNQHYSNRAELLNIFKPSNDIIYLRYNYGDGVARQLDVLFNGGMTFDYDKMEGAKTMPIGIELLAPDPIWYDPTAIEYDFGLSTNEDLIFPITFTVGGGIKFGASTIGDIFDVEYEGNWRTYPSFIIDGPLESFTVENTSTDESIELDYSIVEGETVTINLEYGNKTVVNDSDTNLIGSITPESDLATFHIAADPEVTDGINTLQITGGGAQPGTTNIEFSYYNRYTGV